MSAHSSPDDLAVSGHAFPAGRSQRIPARLLRDASTGEVKLLSSEDGTRLVSATAENVRREPVIGSAQAEVSFTAGWRFVSGDLAGLDTVLGQAKGSTLRAWEGFRLHLVLVAAAVLVSGYVVWRWGIGLLVHVAIAFTPPALPDAIDAGNLAGLDQFMASPSQLSEAKKAEIAAIFARLEAVAPEAPYGSYTLKFRQMPHVGPNAFAMPGGTIIVTDALVQQFPEPDIIAGILGHEIAHVQEEHSLQQLYRSLGTYLLVALIVGDPGPVLDDMLFEGQLLLSLAYSRDHETEADEEGIKIAAAAGFNPAALALFFERLEAEHSSSNQDWLSTHPATPDRIAIIRRLAAEHGTAR